MEICTDNSISLRQANKTDYYGRNYPEFFLTKLSKNRNCLQCILIEISRNAKNLGRLDFESTCIISEVIILLVTVYRKKQIEVPKFTRSIWETRTIFLLQFPQKVFSKPKQFSCCNFCSTPSEGQTRALAFPSHLKITCRAQIHKVHSP